MVRLAIIYDNEFYYQIDKLIKLSGFRHIIEKNNAKNYQETKILDNTHMRNLNLSTYFIKNKHKKYNDQEWRYIIRN